MEKKKGLIGEFKEFIMRGNVMDMAIGVVLATAFGKITTALVEKIIMPFIAFAFGARDMTALDIIVRQAEVDANGEVVKEAIVIGFGTLLMAIIDFILVALVVFFIVKALNKARAKAEARKAAEAAAATEEEPAGPTQEELLTEIRDLLKEQKKKEP
ncbi:MAG: large conductance mechanosensitive channel protein MscL [Lachnospiraceae bacterium]|nr:large conductance mechanosensitive channel protein MscL [Lachnospiraceae bacterium]